jgi:hypothetical protein
MSVMHQFGDATGENQPADNMQANHAAQIDAEDTSRLSHMLIDGPAAHMADTSDWVSTAGIAQAVEAPQATIALNVTDVIDLGTEPIDGIDALIIHGEEGDTVHLANESGYLWSRAEPGAAPEGYEIYQAVAFGDQDIADGKPVYVAVQHDLTVVLAAAI